jgi:hypothetical protein
MHVELWNWLNLCFWRYGDIHHHRRCQLRSKRFSPKASEVDLTGFFFFRPLVSSLHLPTPTLGRKIGCIRLEAGFPGPALYPKTVSLNG